MIRQIDRQTGITTLYIKIYMIRKHDGLCLAAIFDQLYKVVIFVCLGVFP